MFVARNLLITTLVSGWSMVPGGAGAFPHPACSICDFLPLRSTGTTTLDTTNRTHVAAVLFGNDEDATCGDVEERALLGEFTPATCTVLYYELVAQCCEDAAVEDGGTASTPATAIPILVNDPNPIQSATSMATGRDFLVGMVVAVFVATTLFL